VQVDRYALSLQPEMFAAVPAVQEALARDGVECLPLILVDGRIVSSGTHPSRDHLAALAGLTASTAEPSPATPSTNSGQGPAGQESCNPAGGGCCCDSSGSLNVLPPSGCC